MTESEITPAGGNPARRQLKLAEDAGWIAVAALGGAVAVVAGAFAAHGMDPNSRVKEIGWVHLASQYQAVHCLAMLAAASLSRIKLLARKLALVAQGLFLVGIILFPGALYGLALHGPRLLGAVAPVGGLAFILGWLAFAAAAMKRPQSQEDTP